MPMTFAMSTRTDARSATTSTGLGAKPREAGAEREPCYASLGDALAARQDEILQECQARYFDVVGTVDTADPLWNVVTGLATTSIVRWLKTGDAANHDERSKIASVGGAAARQRELEAQELFEFLDVPVVAPRFAAGAPTGAPLGATPQVAQSAPPVVVAEDESGHIQPAVQLSVAMLTKLNFWWSDATCRVLTEEAERLSTDEVILREAINMVVKSSKASLVDMAKRFDDELEALHRRLAVLVLRDPLTGLANRATLMDHLDRAIMRLVRQPAGLALIVVDIDHFKAVNDQYGHDCGDGVLVEVGARLVDAVRPGDLVARLGGDEYVLLFEGLISPAEARQRADMLRNAVAAPMEVGDETVHVTVSIGVATARFPGKRPGDVLAQGALSMSSAKEAGRNQVQVVEMDEGRMWVAQRTVTQSAGAV